MHLVYLSGSYQSIMWKTTDLAQLVLIHFTTLPKDFKLTITWLGSGGGMKVVKLVRFRPVQFTQAKD